MKQQKILVILASVLLIINSLFIPRIVNADTPTPVITPTDTPSQAPTPTAASTTITIGDCTGSAADCVTYYQNKVSDTQGQEKTLSSQITLMDSQIKLTEARIQATTQQILTLEEDISTAQNKINNLEGSLADLTKILVNRVVAGYEVGSEDPFQLLIASNSISDFFKRSSYLTIVEHHDKQLIYDTVQAKNDYTNQKQIFEDKKKQVLALQAQLKNYTVDLGNQKSAKQELLVETQGNEATYQSLLATARAQVAALAGFANARAGGVVSLISHSELSDGWGKYYNQRDGNWGANVIGYSSEQVWRVGCLLTSYAMVVSHFGGSQTPAGVASSTDNFSLGTAFFRIPGPSANGHSANYVQNPSKDQLKSALQNGAAIVAGLSSNGGPSPVHYSDHWVVLRGVDGSGNFIINDPWYADAMNVSLNDHYYGWAIIEARIYQ